jgi:hypothetical protein
MIENDDQTIDLETDLWCMIRGTATRDIVR